MSNPYARVPISDYVKRHHPKLVQEFSETHLPPDELGLWASFKLIVEVDQDGYIAGAPDIAFVDDADSEMDEVASAPAQERTRKFSGYVKRLRHFIGG